MKPSRTALACGLALTLGLGSCSSNPAQHPKPDGRNGGAQPAPPPVGIFAIGLRGQAPTAELLAQPFVDGVSLALEWRQLETAEGSYDFGVIDETLAALELSGKKLVLAPFSFRVPDYLVSSPEVQTYVVPHLGPGFTTPVPWDPQGLERFEALYRALSEHMVPDRSRGGKRVPLRDHSLLVGVSAWVMGMNGIRDIAQISGRETPVSAQPGYSREALTGGILASISTVVDNFPRQFHYVPFFRIADQQASPRLDEHLLTAIKQEYFNGDGPAEVGLFQENLSCNAPTAATAFALVQEQRNTYMMLQMLHRWITPIRGYEGATDRCLTMTTPGDRTTATAGPDVAMEYAFNTFGARYFEIYSDDLLHPGFSDEFEQWNARLSS